MQKEIPEMQIVGVWVRSWACFPCPRAPSPAFRWNQEVTGLTQPSAWFTLAGFTPFFNPAARAITKQSPLQADAGVRVGGRVSRQQLSTEPSVRPRQLSTRWAPAAPGTARSDAGSITPCCLVSTNTGLAELEAAFAWARGEALALR